MTEALLDTQALLWVLAGDARVPDALSKKLDASPSSFGISDACMWEIAIKRSLGKLTTPDDLPDIVSSLGFAHVPISRRQVWAVRNLPFHHRDPFDRLLVAQALDLQLPVVSSDELFAGYGVDLIRV